MSLADEVAQGLRDLIFSGQLVPGDRVGEMEMAARFAPCRAAEPLSAGSRVRARFERAPRSARGANRTLDQRRINNKQRG